MSFKASENKNEGFKPVPRDKYKLVLLKAERKESNNKPGNFYLNAQFSIAKGEYENRRIFHIFNLENSNETATEIGRGELAALMLACGVSDLADMWDVTPLMNKPFDGRVGIDKNEQFGDRNKITEFIQGEGGEDNSVPWGDEPKKKKKKKKKKGKKSDDVPF